MSEPQTPSPNVAEPTDSRAMSADRRNLLQNALGAIERLQAKIDASEKAANEPIAIVGMACRIPGGADTPEKFWDLIANEKDVVGEVPSDRWDVETYYDPDPTILGKARTKAGGFLDQVDMFEPAFFGMSPREAAGVDPQQRLLLETTWDALESAAIAPDQLEGSRAGVFVGITSMDYAQRIDVADPARSDIYLATGTALNAAAGRVSFSLGLRGPCMAIDTACSSSLVAIHTACQSVRNGESSIAIAGGVNVMLSPDPYVLISKWGMLSPDGRCKTFDASANGFVRGEGCGMIVLERLSDAIANGRNIMAIIPGSAINQDGRSSGLTVPNGLAQQEVVRQALQASRLKPTDVSYVEAHGTGTSLGDPIEVEALATVYGEGRARTQPLELGSVKSNIGHLEAASGVASVIKLVMAIRNKKLPASLHVKTLTPSIAWDSLPVRVSTSMHDWNVAPNARRIAGVSAFGFSGMNAHILIAEPPAAATRSVVADEPLYCLPISAKSHDALAAVATQYAEHLRNHGEHSLADVCATAAIGRSHLSLRTVIIAPDREQMIARLDAFANDASDSLHITAASSRNRVAFLFTGQGSQYVGMGRALYDSNAVFKESIDRCALALDPLIGRSLRDVLFTDTDGSLDNTGFTQPALFAIEVALAAVWKSWGVTPSVVTGHSVGEFAAAVVAGVISVEDGARLIAARGRLMQALPAGGVMYSVQGNTDAVQKAVAKHATAVSIAAYNAPDNLTVSGAKESVEQVVSELTDAGIRVQQLSVSHAFHSPLMAPMLDEFRRIAESVKYAQPTLTWISNLTGAALDWTEWASRMSEYWVRHVRESVAFERGMHTLAALECDSIVELGPNPTLIGLGKQCIASDTNADWLPSLKRNRTPHEQMFESLRQLYTSGAPINWRGVQPQHANHSALLPTYPFQRKPFGIPFQARSRRSSGRIIKDLLGARMSVAGVAAQFEARVDANNPSWVAGHRIASEVVMPFTAYLEAALTAAQQVNPQARALEDIEIGEPMPLRDGESRVMQVSVERERAGNSPRIAIYSRNANDEHGEWTLHASASVSRAVTGRESSPAISNNPDVVLNETDVDALYQTMRNLSVEYGEDFAALRRVRTGHGQAIGEIEQSAAVLADNGKYLLHPALLDACFHVAGAAIDALPGADDGRMYLPIGAERYEWHAMSDGVLRCRSQIRAPMVRGEMIVQDVRVEALDGTLIAVIEGLRCRRASRDMFARGIDSHISELLHEVNWISQRADEFTSKAAASGHWVVFADADGHAQQFTEVLEKRGAIVSLIVPVTADAGAHIAVDPAQREHYDRALETAAKKGAITSIASFWPLRVPKLGDNAVPSTLQTFGTDALLHTLQALDAAKLVDAPRFWLVTSQTQAVDGTELINVEQAPVAGLARVAATEHPSLQMTLVDFDAQISAGDINALVQECTLDSAESLVSFRKGVRHVARVAKAATADANATDDNPVRLNIVERGTLENLKVEPSVRRTPGRGEVEIRIRASGLNFRDVLSALGMYPGEIKHLGSDCAGEIVSVGEGVTQFSPGDRVVAMLEGAFASHAIARWEFVAPLPPNVDFEQGASIPTAYLTADITLNHIAGMSSEHRVLIHSGAGGVGMAAIALARRAGAEIFATAGSPEKRATLKRIGVHHVLDSRSTSFADELLRITNGKGVHIALNSLAGALLDRTFDCVADGGVFLEIGKRGLWSHERVNALGRGIRYHIVDCNDNARETPEMVGEIFTRVLHDIDSGALPLLPVTTFPFENAPDAFRYMAQAKHTGRVVFRHHVSRGRIETPVKPDGVYLITGGLRGLGFSTAQQLVAEGAQHLLLVGRNAPNATTAELISQLRNKNVVVDVLLTDVSSEAGVEAIATQLSHFTVPLKGVIHCAAILDDGVLLKQTPARFKRVMQPKADAAWRLHCRLQRDNHKLDFFVLFSSLSAVFGSAGQANYVAANSFLDALAHRARGNGTPMTTINWGAWADVGMAARADVVSRVTAQGVAPIAPNDGLQALSRLLRDDSTQMLVAAIDWALLGKQYDGMTLPPVLRDIVAAAQRKSEVAGKSNKTSTQKRIDLSPLSRTERGEKLLAIVRSELATVLGLGHASASLRDDQQFTTLGLDSLTAVELRNRLQQLLGRPVSATAAFEWPTIEELAAGLNLTLYPSSDEAEVEEDREVMRL